jgi:hypothetical protein
MAESIGMMIFTKEQFLLQIDSSDTKSMNLSVNWENMP